MSKKDYERIAACIFWNTRIDHKNSVLKDALITSLCDYFQKDNSKFDKEKFVKACYQQDDNNDILKDLLNPIPA